MNFGSPIVRNGLIFHVDASDRLSYDPNVTSRWTDMSSNEKSITFSASPTFNYNYGGELSFASASNQGGYHNTFAGIAGSNPSSFEFWVSFTTLNNGSVENSMACIGNSATNAMRLCFIRSNNFAYAYYANDLTYTAPATTGKIYHVVYTDAGNTNVSLYLDGVLKQNANMAAGINTVGTQLELGLYDGGYGLNGKMYAARIYNRVLSAAEVQQNFSASKGRFRL
jgi:hypothetical protein